jgi:hypothetical protein
MAQTPDLTTTTSTEPAASEPEPAGAAGAVVRLTERLLGETRDEIRRADARARQWLAMLGAGAAAVITTWAVSGAPWQHGGPAGWIAGSGLAGAALAAIFLTLALVPRTGGGDAEQVAYFGHIHRIGDPQRVRQLLEVAARDEPRSLVTELCLLSRIAVVKYRHLRLGTVFGTLAGILGLAASL